MIPDARLLLLSDPHLFASGEGRLRGVNTLAALEQVIADVAARALRFDAVLCTGDIVHDEPEGYGHFARVLGALGKPVYCIPGNHDQPRRLRDALAMPPFQVGGQVDLGAWRIVLLDSCVPGRAGGHLSDGELERLRAALAPGERHVLVCLHHHPVSVGSRWLDAVGMDNAGALFEILDADARVRVITWGHVHQCFDARRRGVRLLATPSTCAQFLPQSADFAVDARPPGYRRLTLRPDGTLDTEVIWLDSDGHALEPASHRHA
jgi:Icc protein